MSTGWKTEQYQRKPYCIKGNTEVLEDKETMVEHYRNWTYTRNYVEEKEEGSFALKGDYIE